MARHKYKILYPDGSKAHIDEKSKQDMLRDGVLEHVEGRHYRYTGPRFHFRNLADLSILQAVINSTKRLRHYPGIFVWQHAGRRRRELLEPPDKLVIRLRELGVLR